MNRVLGFEELRRLIGRGRSAPAFRMWVWRQTRAGRFPQALRLAPNSVGWDEQDVLRFLERCRPSTPRPAA